MPIPIRPHAVLLAGALALGACGSAPVTPPQAMELDGTGWVLSSLPGATLTERGRPTLQFSDGHVAGSDGCNRYSGRYESSGAHFRVLPGVAATQMACEPAVDEQARAFMAALLHATQVRIDDAGLSLLDASATTVAGFVAQSTEFAGTSWVVTGVNDGRRDAVVSVLPGSELTLVFGVGATATGSAGCNRYIARYRRSAATLAFESPAATRKACLQPGVMEQERAFLAALANVATGRIEGDRLELRRADGAIALVLHRTGTE